MKTKTLLNRVDTRLAACAAAAAGAAIAAPSAEATIIWSGPVSINVPSTTVRHLSERGHRRFRDNSGRSSWLGSESLEFQQPWKFGEITRPARMSGVLDNFTGGAAASVDNLPAGAVIDGTWNYGRTDTTVETSGPTAFNLSSSNNIFGFRFLNESTGVYDFGWARISLASTLGGQPRAIIEYAYEDTGAGINAGAVPEPSTFALLGVMAGWSARCARMAQAQSGISDGRLSFS